MLADATCPECKAKVGVIVPDKTSPRALAKLSVLCRVCRLAGEPRRRSRVVDSEPPEPVADSVEDEPRRPRRDWLNLNAEE